MKKINQNFLEVAILFVFSLTPLLWLSKNQLILGHDSGFRLDPINHLENLFYSWSSVSNFGVDWSFFKGFLITQLPEAFFTFITHSLWLGQELTFVFWFFIMGIGMYSAIRGFFPEEKYWFFRIFSSVFYIYNFFILQGWFIAERAKFSLYAALPLGFLIILNTFEKKYSLIKGTILFSLLFFFLNGGGNPPLYGGLLLVYVTLFMFLTITRYFSMGIQSLLFSIKMGIAFLMGTILLNSYWILPQAYLALHSYANRLSNSGGVEGILGWEGVISKNASILNLLRLQGIPDWYDNPVHPYSNAFLTNPLLIIISCLPLLMIIIGFIWYKNSKIEIKYQRIIAATLLIFLVSVIFSGGTHAPFGQLYGFLITRIPGFAIFRSSYYKFSPALFFSISFLIGYFLQNLLLKYCKSAKAFIFGAILSLSIFLGYNYPFFITNFFVFNPPFTTKVSLPSYTTGMFSYINKYVDSSVKILLLPSFDKSLSADSYVWGYWSLDALPRIALRTPIVASDSNADIVDALYNAIQKNNESDFLQIAQMTGVRKVLWRGDVLLNDHTTHASDMSQDENNLKSFSSVHLEKQIGLWKLYTIELPPEKLFTPISNLSEFESEAILPYDMLPEVINANFQTRFIKEDQNLNKIDASKLLNSIVVSAECNSCDESSIISLKNSLIMPTVKLLPWSKLYFLVKFFEKRQLDSAKSNPAGRIDIDLSNANKRLVEIWRMGYKDFSANTTAYSEENARRYEISINDAMLQVENLPTLEKNNYIARIIAYIEFQNDYIKSFNQNKTIKNSINELLVFMNGKIDIARNMIWISSANNDKKSFIKIEESGEYKLFAKQEIPLASTISIDGKNTDNSLVTLQKGIHKVEAKYAEPPNRLSGDVDSLSDGTFSIPPDKKIQFSINNFSYNEAYFITFNYIIPANKKVIFSISQNDANNASNTIARSIYYGVLMADGKQHLFSYYYKPTIGTKTVTIDFGVQDPNTALELSGFRIQQDINPRIYAVQSKRKMEYMQPQITFFKNDPTSYRVIVDNAKTPFILFFNQAFSAGWKASFEDGKDVVISGRKHFEIDGYANGWYIDKKGNYTIDIEYMPQQYFYFGIIISLMALISTILIYIKIEKK